MKKHNCEKCRFRAKYDKEPGSFMGRLWRWHINWCPGWRGYLKSLSGEERAMLKEKYAVKQQDR